MLPNLGSDQQKFGVVLPCRSRTRYNHRMIAPLLGLLWVCPLMAPPRLQPDLVHQVKQASAPHLDVDKLLRDAMSGDVSPQERLAKLQIALKRAVELKDLAGEGKALFWLGWVSRKVPAHKDAIKFFEQALVLMRQTSDAWGEAATLDNMGNTWWDLEQPEKAIECFQLALPLWTELGLARDKASTLNSMGWSWRNLGHVRKAVSCFKQARLSFLEVEDLDGATQMLNSAASCYLDLGELDQALDLCEQVLSLPRIPTTIEASALHISGLVWSKRLEHRKAVGLFERSVLLARRAGDHALEVAVCSNLGASWLKLGEYRKGIDYVNSALTLHRKIANPVRCIYVEAQLLSNLGAFWSYLGDTEKALQFFDKALTLHQSTGDKEGEGATLENIGAVWGLRGDWNRALRYFDQALELGRNDERANELTVANRLANIGTAWSNLGEQKKALAFFDLALLSERKVIQPGRPRTLHNAGAACSELMEQSRALELFNDALMVSRRTGATRDEADTLHSIGLTLSTLGLKVGSSAWFKLSVNSSQSLRQGATGISSLADRSLLRSFKRRYDALATTLQSQGRIAEALQVQELQEASRIKEFVYRGTAEQDMFAKRLSLTKLEKHWMDEYERSAKPLGELGMQREEVARIKERLPEQEQALQDVEEKLKVAEAKFKETIDAMSKAFERPARDDNRLVDLTQDRDLTRIAKTLSERTHKKVGCFATLVGERSTSVMFIGPSGKVVTKTLNISRAELSKLVTDALGDLMNPRRRPFDTSKKLYDLVLKPFERELRGLDCLMFNLNGPLRYVPMPALWDGKRYLAERFQVTNFSIAVWENLAKDPPKAWSAEFFGLTQKVEGFAELPGVRAEVEASAPLFHAKPRFDVDFSKSALEAVLRDRKSNLLHFGTHFALDPASSEETFIVLGDGARWRPTEMEQNAELSLEGVELLVAAACSTGVPTGDDESIEGFGAYCQVKGARAVLSSHWEVSDAGTSSWMTEFYRLLAAGKSKGEAYHRAQLAMITGELASNLELPKRGTRGPDAPFEPGTPGFVPDSKRPYAHPFYWAAFTLNGNWR